MKRVICLSTLLSITVILRAQPFAGGLGTEADPWEIETAIQLDSVRHYLSSYFVIDNDISSVGGFEPIGSSNTPFKGSLDGNGKTISDIKLKGVNSLLKLGKN